jgi:mono/diheme cytochrome c family protein
MRTTLIAIIILAVIGFVAYRYYGAGVTESPMASSETMSEEEGPPAGEESTAATEAPDTGATPAAPADSTAASDTTLGAEIYAQFCTGCHGADATGLAGFSGERERFDLVIDGGSPFMPDFSGTISEEERDSLFAYVNAHTLN